MAGKLEIIECLAHRIGDYHRAATVSIGAGCANAQIITVQPHIKFAPRDAITGALKKFNILGESYRATSRIVGIQTPDNAHNVPPITEAEINRYYLRELIQIINPLMVITCGAEVTSLLRGRNTRILGRKFSVTDIPNCTFYSTLNPADYGFAKGDKHLKDQGGREWAALADIYRELKEKLERERWT